MAEQSLEPLLAELRNMLDEADPVPDAVLASAKASFVWRTIDAELAELTADSVNAAGIRAAGAARLLTFEAPGVEVEVEVADLGPTRRLTGQLVPPGPASVTVRWNIGSIETAADDLGRFTVEGVPTTTISLSILRPGSAHPVVTSWVAV
ncbi:MAG: hypothetical protein ACRDV3_06290 [Acidothermaceae bacterium]